MNGPVLFFDGVCNLCNGAVKFVIRHERRGIVHFASLQSASGAIAAAAVRQQYGRNPDSLILLDQGQYFIESDAALRVGRYLDGGWAILSWLRIFPRFLRDFIYRIIARNRYRWFGKEDACMLPTPTLKSRFLDH